jgi:putative endonuclease
MIKKNKDDLPHHQKLGKEGEAFALEWAKHNGYKVLHTNWHFGKKELDIVATKDNVLIVFEVKTRFSDYWEEPKDAVRMRKQKNIIEAADAYVTQFDYDMEVQFDILSVLHKGNGFELEHIPDAFYPTL